MTDGRFETVLADSHQKISIGIRLVAFGVLILLIQCGFWYQQGHWMAFDLRAVIAWLELRPPVSNWSFGQALIDMALACPLCAVPVFLGVIIAGAGMTRLAHAHS